MIKTAIVILNWNGKELLEKFLPSIIKYTPKENCEIYIIDNNSSDDSLAFILSHYPAIQVIELDNNYGYAEGYNKGLSKISAEYYVLLNSDIEVTQNWLYPLIDYLDANQATAIVQPKIIWQREPEYFEYAGAAGGFIDKYGIPFCRGRLFDSLEKDENQYNDIINIFWASGACFAIRSNIFWENEGFDEYFFAHMEEIDLCWRILLSDYDISYIPSSLVYHVGAATLKEDSPQKTYLNYRNNMLMLYKNLDEPQAKEIIYKRRLINFIAALKFLLTGKKQMFTAILKADRDFMKNRSMYEEYRKKNKKSLSNKLIYQRSIILDFFLRGKKKFSELIF